MTEEEAKTKRCCGPEGCGIPVNDGAGRLVRMCIGSSCMGWRWLGFEFERCQHIHNEHVNPADEGLGDGWEWREGLPGDWAWFRPVRNRDGYCGLAGRP